MILFLPGSWGGDVSPPDGVSVSSEYSPGAVRKALEKGERLFFIGADALGNRTEWLFASDHLCLFGTGDLAGANLDHLGPRFPNLRGMYRVPSLDGETLASGTVMRVPDTRFSTGAELKAFPCRALVSQGIDLAVTAAHGGARVIFALNCAGPETTERNSFSFLNRVIQETEGGEE